MDHRWDEMLRAEHQRRVEQSRYGEERVDAEAEAEARRRDRIAHAERPSRDKSPWAIGAAHWDQRDLYTRGPELDERGYVRGPSVHPEVGSYAYPRWGLAPAEEEPASVRPSLYEREAWPWLNYDRFAGKGPKGWRRSDAMIREDVCEALAYDAYVDAHDITVTVEEGEVTLDGTIPDRSHKRIAEQLTERVRGVVDVHNRLTVRRDDKPDGDPGDDLGFAAPIATPT